MNDIIKQQERPCLQCGSLFKAQTSKRKYCSDNCRIAHHRSEQSETVLQQQKVVQQQRVELQELKAAPVTRTQSVREVNPVWQLAQQEYQAQQTYCHDLKQQLWSLQQEISEQTKSGRGAFLGAGAGIACVLIWMAVRYDDRQRKPLAATFAVISIVLLIALGVTGFWIGQRVDGKILNNDEQASNKLSELTNLYNFLNQRFTVDREKLEALRIAVNKVSQYDRETVTRVDEVRLTAAN